MQAKSNSLELNTERNGLGINKKKPKVMQTNHKQQDKIKLNGEELEDEESFAYLCCIITVTVGTEEDVKGRVGKARHFHDLCKSHSPVWFLYNDP